MLEDFKGISSDAKMLVAGTFFSQLAIGLVLTDLAYFLTSVRGLPATFSGIIFSVEGITSVLLSIPLGVLSDIYGRKNFIVSGNVIIGLSILILAFARSEAILLFAAVLSGLSEAAFTASIGALLAQYSTPSKRTSVFSLASIASNSAWGLGGFLLYLLLPLESLGFSTTESHIILYSVLAILTLLSTSLLLRLNDASNFRRAERRIGIISPFTRKILTKYIVANIFVAVGAGMVVPLMSQWFAYKYGVPDSISGPILGISNILIALSSIAAPAAARKLGVVRSIVLTEGLSTIFMFSTPLPSSFIASGAIYITRAFLMNVSQPLSSSLIMGMVPESERGAASGISAAFWRMPNAIGSYPGSALMKEGYLDLPFYIASFLYVISISLFWVWFKKTKMPEETRVQQ